MSEMREWWANVRLYEGPWAGVGNRRETRQACEAATALSPVLPAYRIHVRLKPEGAPKRYAAPHHREIWEDDPDWCRRMEAKKPGFWDRASAFHARPIRS